MRYSPERRQKPDIWARTLFFLNILAWVLLLSLFLIFHRAQPEFESFFDRFYRLNLRTHWDIQYLTYLLYCVSISITVCLSGIFLGKFRGRRSTDQKKPLIITGLVSLVMLCTAMAIL